MMTCDIRRVLSVALLLLAGAATQVCAQQVFVSRLWAHYKNANCTVDPTKHQINCDDGAGGIPRDPTTGNISNQPNIEFDQLPPSGVFTDCENKTNFPQGTNLRNFCNEKVFLCMQVGWSNTESGATNLALDYINFEVFKFKDGTNPLDTGSAPPLRTFYIDSPGVIPADTTSEDPGMALPAACVMWDGSINIEGEFGKSNGQYGFRATVETNQLTAQGNVKISQTRAYPGGWTEDVDGLEVDQKPVTVDVVNIHTVRSTPTVVGSLTGVAAQPYNITYRLAKDATMYLTIQQTDPGLTNPTVRWVVPGQPRVGEGIPNGTLRNGDSWDGRYENGNLAPPGVYLASLQAYVVDQFGADLSIAVTRQLALDTLQITDIRVQPLAEQSTSLAVLSYFLTEPATVYVDIYPPGTQFRTGLNNVNNNATHPDLDPATNGGVTKQFAPCLYSLNADTDCSDPGEVPAPLIRHLEEFQDYRKSVITFWDGRDTSGKIMADGDYIFLVYAALPSANGFAFTAPAVNQQDRRIWSTNAKSGFLPVARGYVTVSQIGPSSTVIGSSPSVAGLDPFTFTYSLSREALVTLKILDANGTRLVKTLVDNQVRPANFQNRERWYPPTDDSGNWLSSGTYLAQLAAADTFFPAKVTTTTVLFPMDLYRITDVNSTPLLTGATDVLTVSYQLSQPMLATLNIYTPGTTIIGSTASWPPCQSLEPRDCWQTVNNGVISNPLVTIKGMRPGRLRITEFWDGRDQNGIYVPDGAYIYTVTAQSTTTPKYFATDRIVGTLTVARGAIVFTIFNITPTFPALFNSSATISLPSYEVDYSVTRQSSVTIQVLTTDAAPYIVRNLVVGQVRDANTLNRDFWDGRNDVGQFVTPGFYTVRAIAEDLASVLSSGSTAQQTISVDPLRIYDVAVSPLDAEFGSALIAFQVSETMRVGIKIFRPGTSFDTNGNPAPPEGQSLVKRIVMVGEARREISQPWDGLDDRGSPVPDSNYLFKIVASTDMMAIDQLTGNIRAGAVLAQDLVIAEIPVVRGGTMDPFGDFERDTYVYPNPVRSSRARFHVNVPLRARVELKIFDIAGDLVRSQSFGERESTISSNFCTTDGPTCVLEWDWDLKNDHGRKVAPGTYMYLVREEATEGSGLVLQTVKKLLIP